MSTTNKISITRALATLKSLDKELQAINTATVFVEVQRGKASQAKATGGRAVSDVEKAIQSNFDKVDSLLKRRTEIKAAIVASNATQTITVGGKTMTVAAAIELKSSVENMQSIVGVWKYQLTQAEARIDSENQQMQAAIDASVAAVGGKDKTLDAATIEAISAPQRAAKEASLINPKDIRARIESMEAQIKSITLDLDYELSESNARNQIEVSV